MCPKLPKFFSAREAVTNKFPWTENYIFHFELIMYVENNFKLKQVKEKGSNLHNSSRPGSHPHLRFFQQKKYS